MKKLPIIFGIHLCFLAYEIFSLGRNVEEQNLPAASKTKALLGSIMVNLDVSKIYPGPLQDTSQIFPGSILILTLTPLSVVLV